MSLRSIITTKTKSKLTISVNGTLAWKTSKGGLHRDPKEGPAVIFANGDKAYWVERKLHRDPLEGPAVIRADGSKEYWIDGKRHRDPIEGPAIIRSDGGKEYWIEGERVYPKGL